mmetsp:Transcript_48530/g.101409  ORF Transcript_48530/g.101409 Transcript_48530/m.101409 type:complete len:216 (+) Transcript_48530:280-927(+)
MLGRMRYEISPISTRQTKHILDWNWRPEMTRDQSVPNWIGQDWMVHSRGTSAMSPLSWKDRIPDPRPAQRPTKPCAQAICDRMTEQPESSESSSDPQIATVQIPQLPQLYPLKYFPSTGKPIFNLKYIMQQAHTYVSKLQPSTAIPRPPSSSSYGKVSESEVIHPESSEVKSGTPLASADGQPADSGQTAVVLADVEAKLSALQRRLDLLQKHKA